MIAMRRRLAAEFIGTFWLVLGGVGSAVLAANFEPSTNLGIGLTGVSLAFGLTVVTAAYALGARAALDDRYASAPHDTGDADALSFFRNWNLASSATKQTINDFFSNPPNLYIAPPGEDVGTTRPGFPECVYEFTTVNNNVIYYCLHETEHFVINYVLEGPDWTDGVPPVDVVDQNGVPDSIDTIAIALEDAWDTYVTQLGFDWSAAPGEQRDVLIKDLDGPPGQVLPFGGRIIELDTAFVDDAATDNVHYLVRHELFHRVQYEYITLDDILASQQEDRVWMEGTAEWAAHQAEYAANEPDAGEYANQLADYLGRPEMRLSQPENVANPFGIGLQPEPNDRQYGIFVLAEHLEDQYGTDAIRQSWVQREAGSFFEQAIENVTLASAAGDDLGDVLEALAPAAHRLVDIDADHPRWRQVLENAGNQAGFPDTTGPGVDDARPARDRRVMGAGDHEVGVAELGEGGFKYIELDPIGTDPETINVDIRRDDDAVSAVVVTYQDYPTVCDTWPVAFQDDLAEFDIALEDGCDYALLVLVHADPLGAGAQHVGWSARLGSGRMDNGTVQLGVNGHGELIVDGDVPSLTEMELQVGMRYMATNADAVSPDCDCEGWGIANWSSGTSGWASFAGADVGGLELLSFSQDADSARSRVSMAGELEVVHDFQPSLDSDYLYEVIVSIENTGSEDADVVYRRFIDWDVEPTPYDEWVTSAAPNGLPATMVYVGNNPFGIDGNPFEFQSSALTGLWEDQGPTDQGIVIDLELGTLAPGGTRTFYLYLGAAGTEADALAAVTAVGAEWYSLAQPDTVGGPTSGTPNTFIFAYRDPLETSGFAVRGGPSDQQDRRAEANDVGEIPSSHNQSP